MSRRISAKDQLKSADRRSVQARASRRAGLGPIGSSMIELIGASLVAKSGALVQPQAAIWSKL
jgi:hypothetical protein